MAIQSHAAPARISNSGSQYPGMINSADALNDLEFQGLLEELTLRINADNAVLEPVPGLDVYMDRPARIVPPRVSRAAAAPERRRGISTNLTAAIISLAMAAGTGWLYLGL